MQAANVWRRVVFPGLLAALALAVAVIGGILTGDAGDDSVNRSVKALSVGSGTFLRNLGFLAPLGLAFIGGMVSAINPCGFAMLPAYLGLYLGSSSQSEGTVHPVQRLGRALLVGGTVTAGFIVLFSVAGIALGLGTHAVVERVTPWFGLVVGVMLAIAGAWILGGGKLYSGVAARAAARIGNPGQVNVREYFLFGLSYGIASLSCTLPIFLIVVGIGLAAVDILTSLGQLVLYALGMGLVIVALTVGTALFGVAMAGAVRKVLPYAQPLGSLLMILAGSYIVFYWLTLGGLA